MQHGRFILLLALVSAGTLGLFGTTTAMAASSDSSASSSASDSSSDTSPASTATESDGSSSSDDASSDTDSEVASTDTSSASTDTDTDTGPGSTETPATETVTVPVTEPDTRVPIGEPKPPTCDTAPTMADCMPEHPRLTPPGKRPTVAGGELPFTGPGDVLLTMFLGLLAGTGGMLFLMGASSRESLDTGTRRGADAPTNFTVAYRSWLREQTDD